MTPPAPWPWSTRRWPAPTSAKTESHRAKIKFELLDRLPQSTKDQYFEIIGIVADAKNRGLQEAVAPEAYIPYTVTGAMERGILVRTGVEPLSMLMSVRREIWSVDRNVALTLTGTLEGYLQQFSYAGPQFGLLLLGIFATVGLILVAIGVFSVMAYSVSLQTHEIGIRMALGSPARNVLNMVLGKGLRLTINWLGDRPGRGCQCGTYSTGLQPVLGRLSQRSADVLRCDLCVDRGRPDRLPDSCAPGNPGQPADRAAL